MRYCNEFRIFLVGVSTFALGVGTSALANETQGEDLSQREIIVTGVPTTYNNSETTEPMIMQQTPLTSPLSMVDNLPGVSVQEGDTFGFDDWSTAISVRGFQTNLDEQQIGITIDGLPNGGSNYGGGSKANRFIDTMNIGRVEVSQGTADIGSLSNEALGGTLNFVTSDPLEDMRARFSVSIGEFDAQRFYARYGACQINPCWLREARNRPIHAAAADAVSHSSMAEVRQRRMVFREM
ncbi:MAG: TonB-dependent receptor plug domain-containing protein, partial [Novosphingobium sp.]